MENSYSTSSLRSSISTTSLRSSISTSSLRSSISTSSLTSLSSLASVIDNPNLENLCVDFYHFNLFKYLDLDDIWSLRLVSKRLYFIVKDYNITELIFLDYIFCKNFISNWFSTTKSTRPGNQLDISKLFLLKSPSFNLINLKYLKIQKNRKSSFELECLNKFTRLQILEIKCLNIHSNDLLQLPDLKALSIGLSYDGSKRDNLEHDSLVIDCINLHSLSIEYASNCTNLLDKRIRFNHPKSIRFLQLNRFDKNSSIFTSLESLEIDSSSANNLEIDDVLEFKKLRKLRFSNCSTGYYKLRDLFNSKKDDLELILDGVRVKEIDKIDEFNKKKSVLEFQLNNYAELEDDLHFVKSIRYNELIRILPGDQQSDLFKKYTNVQLIEIESGLKDESDEQPEINLNIDDEYAERPEIEQAFEEDDTEIVFSIEEEDRLIHFIEECPNLNQLNIYRSSFGQRFFNQFPLIKSLSVFILFNEKDLDLDFEFIVNMPLLKIFITDQDVKLSKRLNLNNFKYLRWFRFKIKRQELFVKKKSKDKYTINNFKFLGLPDHKFINHNKLVKWSNWMRDRRMTSRKRKLSL